MQVFTAATLVVVSLALSSVNTEESKSSSDNSTTITTLDVVNSSSHSESDANSTSHKESDAREKRNLNGFGTNLYNTNGKNKKNYYSSVPKAVVGSSQTAQRRSSNSAGGYPFNGKKFFSLVSI